MSEWVLCVDFGTAYSKAAAAPATAWSRFDPRAVRPLMLSEHEQGNAFLLDSAVFVDDDRVVFGRDALSRADAQANKKRLALRSFKTLLSVSDLDRAMNTNAPASIDPHRVFQMRDLVVLYLAYLLEAVERGIGGDAMVSRATQISRRYAAPAWRSGDSAGMHDTVLRLFAEAEAVRLALGKRLTAREGVSIKLLSDALPKATASARAYDMSLVFEATAAAAYTSIGLEDQSSHLIVVDMGAGTTDIAALEHTTVDAAEIAEARVTLKQAGDFIDSVIANVVIESASWARDAETQRALWTVLMRQMRDIKDAVFADSVATLRHEGHTMSLRMKDIERDASFREFGRSLQGAFDHSLSVVRAEARARRRARIQAVAVGGGASAPFIQGLFTGKSAKGNPTLLARPATPDWAHAPEFQGNLAPVFPQLAIAIGGALAPEGMLAARGGPAA